MLVATELFAAPNRTTYQARIVKPDGYPLEANNVNFRFTILDPTGSCVIYIENYSTVNMANSGGIISFNLGNGTRTYPTSATQISEVFDNSTVSYSCQAPGIYSPASTDTRKIVMQFNDGSGWQTLPAMTINAVPYAMYAGKADDSILFNGQADTNFVKYSAIPTCTGSQTITFNGANFQCITGSGGTGNGGSSYTVTASDVTTALGYTPVNPANVATSFTTVSNSFATVGTSFATVTATLTGYGTSITALSTTVDQLSASMASFVSSPRITSLNGSTSGVQTFATALTGTSPGFVTTNGVHSLNIPYASAATTTAGLISNFDYTNFSNKLDATAASIISALGYTPASLSTVTNLSASLSALSSDFAASHSALAASFSTVMSSQWTTSGSSIFYNSGSVGIGTVNPTNGLQISYPVTGENSTLNELALRISNPVTSYGSGGEYAQTGIGFGRNDEVRGAIVYGSYGLDYMDFYTASPNIVSGPRMRISATGNLGLGTITPVTKLDVSGGVRISMENAACSVSYAGTIRYNSGGVEYCNGSAWTLFGAAGAGLASFNGSTSGTQSLAANTATGTSPSFSTLNGVHTLNIPLASAASVTAGLLSNADYVTFNNKVSSQWNTSGTTINYLTGNVGIGTVNPSNPLTVVGNSTGGVIRIQNSDPNGYSNASVVDSTGITRGYFGYANSGSGSFANSVYLGSNGSNPVNIVTSGVVRAIVDTAGNFAIGVSSATAKLHLGASSNSFAPLKLTSGVLTTSAQSGTIEYDGFNFYVTDGTNTRRTIATASTPGNLNNVSTVSGPSHLTLWPASGNSVIVSATTASINSQTGALVVKGGLGVAGATNLAGPLNVSSTIMSSSYMSAVSLFYLWGTNAAFTNPVDAFAGGERGFTADLGASTAWDLLKLKNASGTQFVVEGGGYTGIGTDDPDRRLTIIGDGSNYGDDVYIEAANSDLAGNFSQVNLVKSRGNVGIRTSVMSGDTLGAIAFRGYSSSSTLLYGATIKSTVTGDYAVSPTADLRIQTISSGTIADRMTITGAGYVGINTSNPKGALDVIDGATRFWVNGNIDPASFTAGNHWGTTSGNNGTAIGWNRSAGGRETNFINIAPGLTPGGFTWDTWNGTSYSQRMRITAAGDLGLGTSVPQGKLHVASNDSATAISSINGSVVLQNTNTTSGALNAMVFQNHDGYDSAAIATVQNLVGNVGLDLVLQTKSPSGGTWNLNQMVLNPNGYVGIGHADPTAPLDISSTGGEQLILRDNNNLHSDNNFISYLRSRDSAGNPVWYIGDGSSTASGTWLLNYHPSPIHFATSGSTKMLLDASGNLGIGTTTPDRKLHIVRAANTSSIRLDGFTAGSSFTPVMGAGSDFGSLIEGADNGQIVMALKDNDGNDGFRILSGGSNFMTNGVYDTPVFTALSSGSVGIGTATPLAKLEVVSGSIRATRGSNPSQYIELYGGDNIDTATYVTSNSREANKKPIFFQSMHDGTGSSAGNLGFYFQVGSSTTMTDLMAIRESGNVGIGVTNPSQKLHVSGSIQLDGDIYGGKYGGTRAIWRFSTADPNFGIFYTEGSPDKISFSPQNGGSTTPTLTIAGDNVGIATSSPLMKFHVAGPSAGSADQTIAQFGNHNVTGAGPLYVTYNAPYISGNAYFNSGWKYGGGSGKAGAIGYTGGLFFVTTNENPSTVGTAITSMATRMVITPTGYVGIGEGMTNPTYLLQLANDSAAKPGTSTWTVASDRRLKDYHGNFTRGLEAMKEIQPVYFSYKKDNAENLPSEKTYVGIFAQDVQKTIPEAVKQQKDGYLHVTNDSIIWTMFNAIKELYNKWSDDSAELHREIASVKAESAAKDQKIKELEERLQKIESALQNQK